MEDLNTIMTLGDNLLVSELTDDIRINGVVKLYDSDSPYMFCKVIPTRRNKESDEVDNEMLNSVLVIKRYAKEEFIGGTYFISTKDVRCYLSYELYDKLKVS